MGVGQKEEKGVMVEMGYLINVWVLWKVEFGGGGGGEWGGLFMN